MVTVGDRAPDFDLPDAQGRRVRLNDLQGRPLVLFFYPADFTHVCTREACGFRDAWQSASPPNAVLMGVSRDSPESHQEFAKAHRLPYPLLTDEGGDVAKAYGAGDTLWFIRRRVTFVIDAAGVVRARIEGRLDAQRHVRGATEALAGLGPQVS